MINLLLLDKMEHYYKGLRQRNGDKAAVIKKDGTSMWFINDKLDRPGDKPAFIQADGTKIWYINGLIDRSYDKPAVIKPDGTLL